MEETVVFHAAQDDEGRRLDRVLRKMLPATGLSAIYRLIRTGRVRLNGRSASPDSRVRPGDAISLPRSLAPAGPTPAAPPPSSPPDDVSASGRFDPGGPHRQAPSEAQGAPTLDALASLLLFEGPHVLAVNKPRGWLVHGPGSLEDPVRLYLAGRRSSLSFRPGPVHRLDRNTSGLILFAASLFGANTLSALLRTGRVDKLYLAVLDGLLERPAVWADELARDPALLRSFRAPGGKAALTEVEPVLARGGLSLVACRIRSGRTHQIRAQAALAGHPLAGDRKYGGSGRLSAYLLHAARLRLAEPADELGFRELEAPLFPADRARLQALFGTRAAEEARAVLSRLLAGGNAG